MRYNTDGNKIFFRAGCNSRPAVSVFDLCFDIRKKRKPASDSMIRCDSGADGTVRM